MQRITSEQAAGLFEVTIYKVEAGHMAVCLAPVALPHRRSLDGRCIWHITTDRGKYHAELEGKAHLRRHFGLT